MDAVKACGGSLLRYSQINCIQRIVPNKRSNFDSLLEKKAYLWPNLALDLKWWREFGPVSSMGLLGSSIAPTTDESVESQKHHERDWNAMNFLDTVCAVVHIAGDYDSLSN
jgi:hypothetical protein